MADLKRCAQGGKIGGQQIFGAGGKLELAPKWQKSKSATHICSTTWVSQYILVYNKTCSISKVLFTFVHIPMMLNKEILSNSTNYIMGFFLLLQKTARIIIGGISQLSCPGQAGTVVEKNFE